MDDALGVHVVDAFQNLEREVLDLVSLESIGVVADHVHQVLRAVLRDQVQRLEALGI